MLEKNSYILIILKRLAILCLLFSSNLLFANVNNAEAGADNADEIFEPDGYESQQGNVDPEGWSSWFSNNIDYYFPHLKQTYDSASSAFSEQATNARNMPTNMANIFTKRLKEMGYSSGTASADTPSSTPTGGHSSSNAGHDSNKAPSAAPSGAPTSPPITIVMQDGNLAQMSGNDFLASTARARKNITQVNSDDNIRNVNLKLHSLYMSNSALSR